MTAASNTSDSVVITYLNRLLLFGILTCISFLAIRFAIHATAGAFADEGPFRLPFEQIAAATFSIPLTLGAIREWVGPRKPTTLLVLSMGTVVLELTTVFQFSGWWVAYASAALLTFPYGTSRRGISTWLLPSERAFWGFALIIAIAVVADSPGNSPGEWIGAMAVTAPNSILRALSSMLWVRCCAGFVEDNLPPATAITGDALVRER